MCINKTEQNIEKIIWLYWAQGWENAPNIVRKCRESWEHHNPDWDIRCLDKDSLIKYYDIEKWMPGPDPSIPKGLIPIYKKIHSIFHSTRLIKSRKIKIQAESDIIRINLLSQHGGIWADATLWCNKPLNEWITPYTRNGFFAFSSPGHTLEDGQKALCSLYFIITSKENHIIKKTNQLVYEYWSNHIYADEYFWINSLFNKGYNSDPIFREIWDKTEKIEAAVNRDDGPEYFAHYTKDKLSDISEKFTAMVDSSNSPVYKLTYRKKDPIDQYDRIKYLFNTIKQ